MQTVQLSYGLVEMGVRVAASTVETGAAGGLGTGHGLEVCIHHIGEGVAGGVVCVGVHSGCQVGMRSWGHREVTHSVGHIVQEAALGNRVSDQEGKDLGHVEAEH